MDMPVACHLNNRTACFYPKRAFHADNGTAECAAAGRYTDRIWMAKAVNSKYHHNALWQTATSEMGPQSYPAGFSAVCWYTGKSLFEQLGGGTPVGLLQTSVGGSPIEYWLPPPTAATSVTPASASPQPALTPQPPANVNACERDIPQCDNQYNDSFFFTDIVEQFVPYTIGALVWDQAERDVKCPVALAAYGCMQRLLTTSWRAAFRSPRAPFIAVQLPGYTAALNNGTGTYPGYVTAEMVFDMRLQQAQGTRGVPNASYVPTYDLSVPTSPYGSVHNVEKGPIGERIATQLMQALAGEPAAAAAAAAAAVFEGPRAISATAVFTKLRATTGGVYTITVEFQGGRAPFGTSGTKNCTSCCAGEHTLDFDVSMTRAAGVWVNGTHSRVDAETGRVSFEVSGVPQGQQPAVVRYTAASIFPQCALKSAEGLPALPFTLPITVSAVAS